MSRTSRQEDDTVFKRFGWTAHMGLSLVSAQSAWAGEPARLGLPAATPIPTVQADSSQRLAESIAEHLEQAGTLKNFRVDVAVRGGVVELSGVVSDQTQRDEVLRLVQGVPGVSRVSDRLTLTSPVVPVARRQEDKADKLPPPTPANDKPPETLPLPKVEANGPIPEPRPIFSAGHPGYAAMNPPVFPPHAWPTYAPHNNYSRVAYPLAYPYKSWPFIGPLYPYPKVPLGWRCVKLEWDDGYWWFSRVGCKHDWWKLRYW
jgi:hypothetical protein